MYAYPRLFNNENSKCIQNKNSRMIHHMPRVNNYQFTSQISFSMYVGDSGLSLLISRALFSFFLLNATHCVTASLLLRTIAPNLLAE